MVEDNELIQITEKNLLESLNCHVTIAPNGQHAIKLYQRNYYDLILMDLDLPDNYNGYEVTVDIKKLESPANQYTPIVALTAHTIDRIGHAHLNVGMETLVTNPLTRQRPRELLNQFK